MIDFFDEIFEKKRSKMVTHPDMVKSEDAAHVGAAFAEVEYWRGREVMRDMIRVKLCSCEYRNGKQRLKLDELCDNCLIIHKMK